MIQQQSDNATKMAYEMIEKKFGYKCIPIRGLYSEVDGFVLDKNEFKYVYEIKVRDFSYQHLQQHFNNELLVSKSKIDAGVMLSRICKIPFYIFVFCLKDKTLLLKRITDNKGEIDAIYKEKVTTTKKTIEGGEADRLNAFIHMTDLVILPHHLESEMQTP